MPRVEPRRLILLAAVVAAFGGLLAALAAGGGLTALATAARPSQPALHVAPGSPVRDPERVQEMLAAADAHWRSRAGRRLPARCRGAIVVHEGGPATGAVAGYALPPCRMWLNPAAISRRTGRWRATLCDVVVHEVGHLLGFGHADAAGDIMSAELPAGPRPRARACAGLSRP